VFLPALASPSQVPQNGALQPQSTTFPGSLSGLIERVAFFRIVLNVAEPRELNQASAAEFIKLGKDPGCLGPLAR
jgi:hypothetical protein